ncbi:hypothetical protein LZ32DRAFT_326037 [Colletotrichum eremochloae]|nr:hypothetical protein LZ32DRAFT_326037 [Colletotrichum eremochloae]
MDHSPPITIRSESPDGKQVAPGPSDSSRRKLSHCFRCLHLIAKFGNSKRIRCGAIPSTRTRVLASCNYCRKTRQTCGMVSRCSRVMLRSLSYR